MDIKHPGEPLTARQVGQLAALGLPLRRLLPQLEYRSLSAFRADCNNFPVHFWPPRPGTLAWEAYGQRPVFRRLEALFPEVLAQARDCIKENSAGIALYRVRPECWGYLLDVYRLMSFLVDADDVDGLLDSQHLVR